MCLPSILEIAEQQGLEINPSTLNKKEVYAKCPFCDSGKFKLSMNTEYNVFKCWLCQTSGGVIDFESKLTGKPFNEVKNKYFNSKKKQHPAEYLNPNQLKHIGWNELKRRDRESFKEKRDEVLNDWKLYQRDKQVLHFAMLMVVAHLEGQEERRTNFLEYIFNSAKDTGIPMLFSTLMEEYLKESDLRSDWAIEGIEIGRIAWRTSVDTLDFDMDNVMKYVLFAHHFTKNNKRDQLNQVV